jgi:hypothetical protein
MMTMGIKSKYRITNWKEYNNSLIKRGSICLYINESITDDWEAKPKGKPGHPKEYSDKAIKTMLMVKKAFHLKYRQTQGFMESVFQTLGIDLKVPHYSNVSRRSGKLDFDISTKSKENVFAILDSTGLKVFGEGEWKVRKHGYSKRRTWKKLHIAIDSDGEIRACELTDNSVDDAEMTDSLTKKDKEIINKFSGDGAYDKNKVYQLFDERVQMIVPPRTGAKKGLHKARNDIIAQVELHGLDEWKIMSGYHKRSLVETTMFRLKTIFSDKLFSRSDNNQVTEAKIMCEILNKFSALGMPVSVPIT